MSEILAFPMFLLVFGTGLTLMHYYVWRRKVRDTALPLPWRIGLTLLLFLGWATVLGGYALWKSAPTGKVSPFVMTSFVWLGSIFYLALFYILWDGLRLTNWVTRLVMRRKRGPAFRAESAVQAPPSAARAQDDAVSPRESDEPAALDRRAFLSRVAAVTAAAATSGVAFAGVRSARGDITTPEVLVHLPRLPRALDGFRIVHLTDLHLGPVLDGEFTQYVVDRVNGLKPDLVAITGDLVDGPVSALEGDVAPLARLRSRFGTYFVTGNHDFYSGVRAWMDFLPRCNVRVLANERISIGDAAPRGASFDLAGIHDRTGKRVGGEYAPRIDPIVADRDPDRELVLLAHQPVQVDHAVRAGAGLQLSGHTHGGQLWPFGALVLLSQPYLFGLHRHTAQTQIYVSRGTGFWGPPMRVLAPAEITSIVLKS